MRHLLVAVLLFSGLSSVALSDEGSNFARPAPALVASGRTVGATAAVTTVCTHVVGSFDGSFEVSACALVTSYTSGNFTIQVTFTDETGAAQTAKVQGYFGSSYGTTVNAAGSFEGSVIRLHAKLGTVVTVSTTGTFTTLIYNVEADLRRVK